MSNVSKQADSASRSQAPRYLSARREVEWGDCDPAGIAFYPRFFAWMDHMSHVLGREMGLTPSDMVGNNAHGFPLVAAQAEFLSPARLEDQLEVRVYVTRLGRSSLSLR